ncbi:methyltransferase domain-containing protein, partial [Chloroflexota bacterium]
ISNAWIIISSTAPSITIENIRQYKKRGLKVLYDYIDAIHPDITDGAGILLKRHTQLDSSHVDLVLTVSTILYEEMIAKFPKERVFLHPNGVEYGHFHRERDTHDCPKDMKSVVEQGKPIIGYYGAFARWIDYEVLNYLSANRPDWNMVLIGVNYDNSMRELANAKNMFYLGVKGYQELPRYGIWFDVTLIPFERGGVAKATSPIKLYEYMAMNKPVVVTQSLTECLKYEGVLVGTNKEDFLRKVEEALRLKNDPSYLSILDRQARENTWESRARDIDTYIKHLESPLLDEVLNNRGRFEKLLMGRFNIRSFKEVTDPVVKMWLEFAASTVQRGEQVTKTLSNYTEIKGKRCLDVGCAYGGFPLALERAGATEAVGIDVDADLLALSDALREDHHAGFKTYKKSILDRDDLMDLGTFDIITCNDVMEHVNNPEIALTNMVTILNPGGVIYFGIPNRFSASFVKSDGHFGMFGITLLPKHLADEYFSISFSRGGYNDIYYKGLNYYLNTLRGLGTTNCEILNTVETDPAARLVAVKSIFAECRKIADGFAVDGKPDLTETIARRIRRIADLFDRQYARYVALKASDPQGARELGKRLILSFVEDFWYLIARKPASKRGRLLLSKGYDSLSAVKSSMMLHQWYQKLDR